MPKKVKNPQTGKIELKLSKGEDDRAACVLGTLEDFHQAQVPCYITDMAAGLIDKGLANAVNAAVQASFALRNLRVVFGEGVYICDRKTNTYAIAENALETLLWYISRAKAILRQDDNLGVYLTKGQNVIPGLDVHDVAVLAKHALALHRDMLDALVDKLPAGAQKDALIKEISEMLNP